MVEIKNVNVTTKNGKARLSADIAISGGGGGILFGLRSMKNTRGRFLRTARTPLSRG